MTEEQETVQEQETIQEEKIELTPDEIALASGEPVQTEEEAEPVGEREPEDTPTGSMPGGETDDGSGGGGTEAADTPPPWITDDLLEVAGGYGLSKEDVAGFTSAADFGKATALLDQRAKPTEEPPGEPAEETPGAPADEVKGLVDRQRYVDAGYDEDTLALVDVHNDMVNRLEETNRSLYTISAAAEQQEADRRNTAFHDLVDTMDETRYGRSLDNGNPVQLSESQNSAREKLWEATRMVETGIAGRAKQSGRDLKMPAESVLLRHAEQYAFGEEIREAEKRERAQKIASQSKRRRPSPGRAKVQAEPQIDKDKDPAQEVADHPEVAGLWDKLQKESGAV